MGFFYDEEWKLFFDGSKCINESEEIILISPHDDVIPILYKLHFDYTNNMVEYKDLILGFKKAILLKVH